MWSKLKGWLWEWRGVLVAAPSAATIVIVLRLIGALQSLEWGAIDQFLRWRPQEPADDRIVIVGINETDINRLDHWPTTDAELAELLKAIRAQSPAAIGLDIVRDRPMQPGHDQLVEVFRTTPNLIGGEKISYGVASATLDKEAIAPPPVLAELGQVAAVNLIQDNDGTIRRGLVAMQINDAGDSQISFGLYLAALYLEAHQIPYVDALESMPPLSGNFGGYANADTEGVQFFLDYRNAEANFTIVSMFDVLDGKVDPDLMRDRIVLIGITAASEKDYFVTPLDRSLFNDFDETSGVEIHAQVVSYFLSYFANGRMGLRAWSEPIEWIWIVGWAIAGSILSWMWRHARSKGKDTQSRVNFIYLFIQTISTLALAGLLVGISFVAFLAGWWIPVVPPLMALTISVAFIVGYIAQSAAEIRAQFGRYLSDEVVSSLLETPEGLKLGGQRSKVTVMMCDLRGFSSISERIAPESVVQILNIFLGTMAEVIVKYQGTIDEFIGDAILAIFGAPILGEDDAERAVACAVEMQLKMDEVNERIMALGLPKIAMGIGINTGEVVVGNIGSNTRAKYGIVGSNVNLTARIESYTVGGQILISEPTYKAVPSCEIAGSMQVEPKGVTEPITIYEVSGVSKYDLYLSSDEDELRSLVNEVTIEYKVLQEKHLGNDVFKGRVVRLSPSGAEIISDAEIAPMTNIRIIPPINVEQAETDTGFYAKVLDRNCDSQNGDRAPFYIHFTTVPPEAEVWLERLYAEAKQVEV
jgi:adenylate cyclase